MNPLADSVVRLPLGAGHFFIVGCPRSGTTLLSVLLDRHSRLCVPPETGFFDEIAPQLRVADNGAALLEVLRAWRRLPELQLEAREVLSHLVSQGRPLTPGHVLSCLLELYAGAQGKLRCGEKTPQHLAHAETILRCFQDAPVFCLLRDGRDVALSLRAMPWWGNSDVRAAADHWRRCLRQMEDCMQADPNRFKVVRFEDLVGQPEVTLSAVMETLCERFEPQQLHGGRPSGAVLARSWAWKGHALEAVDSTRIAGRRAAAHASELVWLNDALGDDLRRYGYLV